MIVFLKNTANVCFSPDALFFWQMQLQKKSREPKSLGPRDFGVSKSRSLKEKAQACSAPNIQIGTRREGQARGHLSEKLHAAKNQI